MAGPGSRSAIEAGRAYFSLFAETSGVEQGLNAAQKAVESFLAGLRSLGSDLLDFAPQNIGFLDAAKDFAQFDDNMRTTWAVSRATEKEFLALSESALALSRSFAFMPKDIGAAMANLGRAGFNAKEIDDATEAVMMLSRATGTELARATEIAANVLREFSLPTNQAIHVADALAAAANASTTNVDQLGNALSYVGPIAAQAGLSLKDTVKATALLANFGIQGSRAGTALRQMLSRMAVPAVQKHYQQLGVSIKDSSGKFRDFGEILKDVGKALAKLPQVERMSALRDLFGVYGLAGGAVLTEQGLDALADAIDNCAGVTEDNVNKMDAGLGGFLRRAAVAFKSVSVLIGRELAPFFLQYNKVLGVVRAAVEDFIKSHGKIVVGVFKASASFAAVGGSLLAAAGGAKLLAVAFRLVNTALLFPAIRLLTPIIAAAVLGFRRLAGTAALLTVPFRSVSTGIMAAALAVKVGLQNINALRNLLERLGAKFPRLAGITDALSGFLGALQGKENVLNQWTNRVAALGTSLFILPKAVRGITATISSLGQVWNSSIRGIGIFVRTFFGSLNRVSFTIIGIGGAFLLAARNLDGFKNLLHKIGQEFPPLETYIKAIIQTIENLSWWTESFEDKARVLIKIGAIALTSSAWILALSRSFTILNRSINAVAGTVGGFLGKHFAIFQGVRGDCLKLIGAILLGQIAFKVLSTQIKNVRDALVDLQKAFPEFSGIISKIDAIFAVVEQWTNYIYQNFDAIKKNIFGTFAALGSLWAHIKFGFPIIGAVLDGIALIVEAILMLFEINTRIPEQIADVIKPIIKLVSLVIVAVQIFKKLSEIFGWTEDTVDSFINNIVMAIGNGIEWIYQTVIGTISKIIGKIKEFFGILSKDSSGFGASLFDWIVTAVEKTFETAFNIAVSVFNRIKPIAIEIFKSIWDYLAGIFDTVKSMIPEIKEAVQTIFQGLKAGEWEKTFTYLIAFAKLHLYELWQYLKKNTFSFLQDFVPHLNSLIEIAVNGARKIYEAVDKLFGYAKRAFDDAKSYFSYLSDMAFRSLEHLVSLISNKTKSVFYYAIKDVLKTIYQTLERSWVMRKVLGIDEKNMNELRSLYLTMGAKGKLAEDAQAKESQEWQEYIKKRPEQLEKELNDNEQTRKNRKTNPEVEKFFDDLISNLQEKVTVLQEKLKELEAQGNDPDIQNQLEDDLETATQELQAAIEAQKESRQISEDQTGIGKAYDNSQVEGSLPDIRPFLRSVRYEYSSKGTSSPWEMGNLNTISWTLEEEERKQTDLLEKIEQNTATTAEATEAWI